MMDAAEDTMDAVDEDGCDGQRWMRMRMRWTKTDTGRRMGGAVDAKTMDAVDDDDGWAGKKNDD